MLRSPHRDLGCLLALAGQYRPPTRLPFLGLPSGITRHHETTEHVFLPCTEDPGQAPKMVVYCERCQTRDLQRFNFGTSLDHPRAFVQQSFIKVKRDRESF